MNIRVNETVDTQEFQPLKTVAKRFKSKYLVLNQQLIYVYCPVDRELDIGQIIDDYSFDMVVNDYSITDLSYKVICHFEIARLTKEQRQFLVKATELGAGIEPLVSYLDERLSYTEVRLLHSGYSQSAK